MMFQYPQAFPVDEANSILALMSGTQKPTNDTYRAGWALAGYALSQIAPTVTIKGGFAGQLPAEKKKALYESLKAATQHDPNLKQGLSVPWHDLFVLLVQALQQGLDILVNVNP